MQDSDDKWREVMVLLGNIKTEIEQLWSRRDDDRQSEASLSVRLERLEGAFEAQWCVLRRLELGAVKAEDAIRSLTERAGHLPDSTDHAPRGPDTATRGASRANQDVPTTSCPSPETSGSAE